jgi:hypothetical protein
MTKSLILLALIIGIRATSALACGCIREKDYSLADDVKASLKSEAVFVGKVDRFEYRAGVPDKEMEEYQKTHPGFTWKAKMAILRVDRWWTGSLGPEFVITTNETIQSDGIMRLETSCGFWLELGKSYLVFTRKYDGYFRTPASCGLTRKIEDAKETLALLGSGKEPVKDKSK